MKPENSNYLDPKYPVTPKVLRHLHLTSGAEYVWLLLSKVDLKSL